MKQSEVAAALGRPQSYISQVEKGSHRVTAIELIEFAEVLKFDVCAAMRRVAAVKD